MNHKFSLFLIFVISVLFLLLNSVIATDVILTSENDKITLDESNTYFVSGCEKGLWIVTGEPLKGIIVKKITLEVEITSDNLEREGRITTRVICFKPEITVKRSITEVIGRTRSGPSIIFQEDFESDLNQWEISNPGSVNSYARISTQNPYEGVKSLEISYDGSGVIDVLHSFSTPQQGKITAYFYDDLSLDKTGFLWASKDDNSNGVSVGVRTNLPPNEHTYPNEFPKYVSKLDNFYPNAPLEESPKYESDDFEDNYFYQPIINPEPEKDIFMDTHIPRTQGWHKFEIEVTPKGSVAKIDDQSLVFLPAVNNVSSVNHDFTSFTKIGFQSAGGVLSTLYFDNLTIETIPLPPSNDEIMMERIEDYLKAYGHMGTRENIDHIRRIFYERYANNPDKQYLMHGIPLGFINNVESHIVRYYKKGNPEDLQKAINTLEFIDSIHEYWKPSSPGEFAFADGGFALSSWLIWDELPSSLQTSIKQHLIEDLRLYSENPQGICSEYIGNTCSEENRASADFLVIGYLMFRDEPEAEEWLEKAKLYTYHSITNLESPTYGGIKTQTVYGPERPSTDFSTDYNNLPPHDSNYFLDNHGYHPHPGYAIFGLVYSPWFEKVDLPTPPEFHSELGFNVWKTSRVNYIDFRTFEYKGDKIWKVRRICESNSPEEPVCYRCQDDSIRYECPSGEICDNPKEYAGHWYSERDGDNCHDFPKHWIEYNAFKETKRDDWGSDAVKFIGEAIVANKYYNWPLSYYNSETGFQTDDIIRHNAEFYYYIKKGLNVPVLDDVVLNELDIRTPGTQSYIWERRNAPYESIGYFIHVGNTGNLRSPVEIPESTTSSSSSTTSSIITTSVSSITSTITTTTICCTPRQHSQCSRQEVCYDTNQDGCGECMICTEACRILVNPSTDYGICQDNDPNCAKGCYCCMNSGVDPGLGTCRDVCGADELCHGKNIGEECVSGVNCNENCKCGCTPNHHNECSGQQVCYDTDGDSFGECMICTEACRILVNPSTDYGICQDNDPNCAKGCYCCMNSGVDPGLGTCRDVCGADELCHGKNIGEECASGVNCNENCGCG